MNTSKQNRKKRPKRPRDHSSSGGDGPHSTRNDDVGQKQKQQENQVDKQKKHQEALALSQELRHLSSQKRLKECLELYRSPNNDHLRDAHHGSIIVDCCARCGDVEEAEGVVNEMLQSRGKSQMKEPCPYFWDEYKNFSYKQVPIQAWTALLKAYVHAGMMAKADSLFHYLCCKEGFGNKSSGGGGGDNRKRKRDGASMNGLNVRTLNTLLRGCMWTATSINDDAKDKKGGLRNELVGGVVTAERAWSLCQGNISFDASSYEYFIGVLSQSLQCKRAEGCLQKMRKEFGMEDGSDPTNLESLVVCLVVIARGYAILGELSDAQRCAKEALQHLDTQQDSGMSAAKDASSAKKKTIGGKRAWKDSKSDSRDDGNPSGRREESNKLFRNHRLSELTSEAQALFSFSSSMPTTEAAQLMLTRLLYFSGGGTTGKKDAKTNSTDVAMAKIAENDILQVQAQWIHSLWNSFGLRETCQQLVDGKDKALKSILYNSSKKKSKKENQQLPSLLSPEVCNLLRSYIAGKESVISSKGRIDFTQVFKSFSGNTQKEKQLHIELGAGSGDWASLQAELNPSGQYVTVELRADRVGQTFGKTLLRQVESKHAPLTNLCSVGSECGSFLRDRVTQGTVNTIFVNHPEPPTQTYSVGGKLWDVRANGSATDFSAEEPAHMLNSQTIISAARCLEPNGQGRLIIVTDNLIYARLICQTVVHVLNKDAKLVGVSPGEVRDLRRIESFGNSSVMHLYEGKPSLSIGHYTHTKSEGGTSYFDRLWRTGAGKHADMRKRFIIALRTNGGTDAHTAQNVSAVHTAQGAKPHVRTQPGKNKAPNPKVGDKKSHKKKNDEKQRRRNERRLLKKQQEAAQKAEKS